MMNANKFLCIHGHFYQPPRENAWLEVIEKQDSAAPFHDWNERINFECYATNAAARILDSDQNIVKIVNNYTRISFNFGPTLLSWIEKEDPVTYQAILNADKVSLAKFGGHGSALAQVHSHLILPLANARDKETQVKWGVQDFEYRFGRKPEGMWLSETAVNTETLEVLADNDIKFTILAPRQAKAIKKVGEENWTNIPSDSVDPRRPYLYKLPSGKTIALFFYDGGIAQGVAFNGLLNNGKGFAQAFLNASDGSDDPQLIHIATDGESYGHHHQYGEMALADALNHIEENKLATITNYGQYLELFPPTYEVQIHENSSWSCVHGVERWQSNCGCNTGGRPGWTQTWREPLRNTLNWLRDQLIPVYEREASPLLKDIWAARNDYINVLLNRNDQTVAAFFERNATKELSEDEKILCLRLLEMQRNAMLMFTSCGWFFDEISGIETDQILQYANRTTHYAHQITGIDYHEQFIQRLREIPSNMYANGAISYEKHVVPARVDLVRVAMHYAISSLFEAYPETLDFFNYVADSEFYRRRIAGTQRLAYGRTTMRSKITHSKKHFSFAVLYLGQQNVIGNISVDLDRATFNEMASKVDHAFQETNLGEVIGIMQSYFGPEKYNIWHLFRDAKRKILKEITNKNLSQLEVAFNNIYNDNYQLMIGIQNSNIPIPESYQGVVQSVVNSKLHQFFENGTLSIYNLKPLANELRKWNVQIINEQSLKFTAEERIFKEISNISNDQENSLPSLNNLHNIVKIIEEIGIHLNFWKSQNLYFSLLKGYKSGTRTYPNEEWKEAFLELGTLLKIKSR